MTMYTVVTATTPTTSARGSVRPGSRNSPAIFAASHHPPKQKNAPTNAAPNAGANGNAPERCATKGTKFDQEPRRKARAQTVRVASTANFSQVIQRRKPALMRVLNIFKAHKNQIAAIAAILIASGDQWKMYAAYEASPVANAPVSPGSRTSRLIQP